MCMEYMLCLPCTAACHPSACSSLVVMPSALQHLHTLTAISHGVTVLQCAVLQDFHETLPWQDQCACLVCRCPDQCYDA